MQREEAKQLLELCRPGNEEDRQDPALAEAFALLETDAELQAWFDEQQAIDARISESINAIEPPADLKASILAGMRLHQAHATPEHTEAAEAPEQANGHTLPFSPETARQAQRKATWFSPWIGIAALFAIMMVFFNLPKGPQPANDQALAGLPPVLQFLSQEIDSLKPSTFDKRDTDAGHLQTYLASMQAPAPQSIPDCLDKMATVGCVTYEYGNTKLSMICFKNGDVYHLITADKATYPDALPTEPQTYECSDKAFKLWVDGDQVKILSVHGTEQDIPEFI